MLVFDDEHVYYRVIEGAEHDGDNGFAFGSRLAQLGHKLWPSLKILVFEMNLVFDDGNMKYRVIEDVEDDGDNGFPFGSSLAQLGHKLWPSLVMLDFDE